MSELDIPISSILVNTGDPSVTKDEDIKNFNNLDVIGTEGSKKQFIILVERGERVGIVVHCLELLYLEVQNQKYLFYRLQCVA